MPEKVKKSIFSAISGVVLVFLVLTMIFNVRGSFQRAKADTVTTTVQVTNSAPQWTVYPFEDPASATTTPTNVGTQVTFKAVATDANADDYFLAVCKTNAVTPHNGAPPTCDGGTWCISATTTSGTTSTCSYTAQESDTNETYEWYAFVCDAYEGGALCGSVSQGSGPSGSPFVVNHRPNFTVVLNDSPKDPGQTITWTTTASDPDTIRGGDTIKLFVCSTSGFNPTSGCTGETLATSTFVLTNPSASYSIPIPKPDMTYDAYVFIIDQFNLAATGTAQGSNSQWTVNNVPPYVVTSTITILNHDGSTDRLILTTEAGTTTGFKIKYQIVDNNSCWASGGGNEISNAIAYVYRSGIGQAGCDSASEANNNNCYPEITDFVLETCPGSTTAAIWATTTFTLWYHADPTVTSTKWETEVWKASVKAIDDDNATSTLVEGESSIELDAFLALAIQESAINYGSVMPDVQSDQQTTTIKATGNTGLDQELGGNPMVCSSGGCGNSTISVDRQYWYLTSGTNWGATPTSTYQNFLSASSTPVYSQLECPKSTSTTPASKPTYWRIKVVAAQPRGLYTGLNYFTAMMSTSSAW
jgi:hypothetical protein